MWHSKRFVVILDRRTRRNRHDIMKIYCLPLKELIDDRPVKFDSLIF